MPEQQPLRESARRFYRSYRNGRIRVGHSLLKRFIGLGLAQEQEVRLRSGLALRLDLSKPNQAGIYWYDGDADAALYWAIRELVPIGGLFVDCGANCGLMGLLAAQYRGARVLFIEPHPRLAKSIETNIRMNHFESRAAVIQMAMSDSSGEFPFYENPTGDDGTHSLHADWGEGEKRLLGNIRCGTLKELVASRGITQIDFLKSDTEGNDLSVLQGLGDCLQPGFTRVIYVEMTRNGEAMARLLAERGYTGFTSITKRGRELAQLQQRYEQGGVVSFFRPLAAGSIGWHNALWCGAGSPTAAYLQKLCAS